MKEYLEIERSLITTYRKSIWRKFVKGVRQYDMIQPGDKIAVCISGGKDSMLLAKCMQELQRHGNVPFELVFLVMDPGYNKQNLKQIEHNAKLLNIPITIFSTNIFDSVVQIEKNPCYVCARMRRGHLYHKAQDLGCNKIALGHHFDDVIETILLSMLYGGEYKTMMPKLHSKNYPGMELIRPMYLVREQDIISFQKYHHLTFLNCACRFVEQCATEKEEQSKRLEIKRLIQTLKKENPNVEYNIFKSSQNVHLRAILGYQEQGVKHSFLDCYDDWI